MKKSALVILTLFFLSCGSAKQENIEITQLEQKGNVYYLKNKPYNGKAFEFFDSEKKTIKTENTYKDGISETQVIYYQGGQKQEEGPVKNEKKDDKWLFYYDTGELRQEAFYKDGKLDGKIVLYSKSGEIEEEGYYKDGIKDGTWSFYMNGVKKRDAVFKDGSENIPVINGTASGTELENPGNTNSSSDYTNSLLKRMNTVDKKYKSELYDANSTVEMNEAVSNAITAWDNELNKVYKLLLERLSNSEKENLKAKQRQWIKNRDQKVNSVMTSGGTMDSINGNSVYYEETKNRTIELAKMYDKIN